MSFLMPKQPAMPAATRLPDTPPVAERSSSETSALADTQRRNMTGKGRAMTMLTGGGGADSAISAVRFLGGAART